MSNPVGDANHNSRLEQYLAYDDEYFDSIIGYEQVYGDSFQYFGYPVSEFALPTDFRDSGADGLAELLVTTRMNEDSADFKVLESQDSWSFPCTCVWHHVARTACPWAKFADLDRDGRTEILIPEKGAGLVVFEDSGGGSYDSVGTIGGPGDTGFVRYFCFGDFSGGGHTDVACGDGANHIYVFEAKGNHQYPLVAVCTTAADTAGDQVNRLAASPHISLDGKPGFVAFVNNPNMDRLMVYQSNGQGGYEQTWCTGEGFNFGKCLATGDMDGDGLDEIGLGLEYWTGLYKCVGPGNYELVWSLDSGYGGCTIRDVNGDDRAELTLDATRSGPPHCSIYEDTEGLAIAEFSKFSLKSPVRISPSVARLGATLLLSGLPPGADIEVLSLDGRLVSRAQGVRQSTWTWDLCNQPGNLVPAGTYFAVIRNKGKSTSLKLCLVK